MSLPHLSLADAHNLRLTAQGLLNKPRRRVPLEDVPTTISRISSLQTDTINIVVRSPHLVLFSRLGDYPAQWLDGFLARRELVEYWAHGACFMPRSSFRLIRHRMLAPEKVGWKHKDAWVQEHTAEAALLIQHIHNKGPVCSTDFKHPRKGTSGWWEWKPHRRYLEGLSIAGKVVMIERRNFQRVYDLTHRVMPGWDDERGLVSQTGTEIIMLDNSVRSLGISHEQWLTDYYRLKRPTLAAQREARAEQQQIVAVHVEKLGSLWLHVGLLPLLERAPAGKLTVTHSAVLSSFDPIVWDCKRAEQLFDFSHRLECYIPASKRQYGYFVPPLLHRERLVGRIGAKMHRQAGVLEVISLRLQESIKPTTALQKGLCQAIADFANWQQTTRVALGRCPQGLLADYRTGWEIDSVA